MAIPVIARAVAGAGKQVAKQVPKMKKITKENARSELSSFVQDYSKENLEKVVDGGSKLDGFKEGAKEVAEDVSGVFDTDSKDVAVENTEEILDEAKEKAKEKTKPLNKAKGKFDKGKPDAMVEAIKNLPTRGGIVLLLVLVLFILFAIQPVITGPDGKKMTRLGLLWRSIIGRTYIGEHNPDDEKSIVGEMREIKDDIDYELPHGGWSMFDPRNAKENVDHIIEEAMEFKDNSMNWIGGLW